MLNKLEYTLVQLQEECAEVSQRAAKALRFGMYEIQPGQEKSNLERLEDEAIDLLTMLAILDSQLGDVMCIFNDPEKFELAMNAKKEKVLQYMKYSREKGLLE